MDAIEAITEAVKKLPAKYEPLQLTFYDGESRPKGNHVLIGDDYGTEFQVRLSDGAVVSIDPQGELPSRFVNSSVEQLGSFIETYRTYGARASADSEVAPLARQLRERLAAIDPSAFDAPENWWAVVLEQAEDGLL